MGAYFQLYLLYFPHGFHFYLRVLFFTLGSILMFYKKLFVFCNLLPFTDLIFILRHKFYGSVYLFQILNTPLQLSYPKIPFVTIISHLYSSCIRVFLLNLYSGCNQSTTTVFRYENLNIRRPYFHILCF